MAFTRSPRRPTSAGARNPKGGPQKPARKPAAASSKPAATGAWDGKPFRERVLVEKSLFTALQAERHEARAWASAAETRARDESEACNAARHAQAELTARVMSTEAQARGAREAEAARAAALELRADAAEQLRREAVATRAAALADLSAVREELAAALQAGRTSHEDAVAARQSLSVAEVEARAADQTARLGADRLRELELAARSRAAALEARLGELEPAYEECMRQRLRLVEQLAVARAEVERSEERLLKAAEQVDTLRDEREAALLARDGAEADAREARNARDAACSSEEKLAARLEATETDARAAAEAAAAREERSAAVERSLGAKLSLLESRCEAMERSRDSTFGPMQQELSLERAERARLEAALRTSQEALAAERRRGEAADERCALLGRQRDEAAREREKGARALSAARLEKRELEWAMGDLRWETPRVASAAAAAASDGGGGGTGTPGRYSSGGLGRMAAGLSWPEARERERTNERLAASPGYTPPSDVS